MRLKKGCANERRKKQCLQPLCDLHNVPRAVRWSVIPDPRTRPQAMPRKRGRRALMAGQWCLSEDRMVEIPRVLHLKFSGLQSYRYGYTKASSPPHSFEIVLFRNDLFQWQEAIVQLAGAREHPRRRLSAIPINASCAPELSHGGSI